MAAASGEVGEETNDTIHFVKAAAIDKAFLQQQSLLVIGAESWRKLIG